MTTMNLRAARPNDARTLAHIQLESIRSLSDLLPADYIQTRSEDALFELWNHELKSSLRKTFVAETPERHICGFVSIGPSQDADLADRPAGELLRLYLLPSYMGRGTGFVLMEHGLSILKSRGYDPIMLWVFASNTRARKFYLDQGWEEDPCTRMEAGMSMVRYFWPSPN